MNPEDTFDSGEKVRFLGAVIASVSHELKNALATVHETAGLLSDITGGSEDLAAERHEISRCVDDISEGLGRAFRVIGTLNVFAHSADEPMTVLELAPTVELVTTLAGYLSYAGQSRLVCDVVRPVSVLTSPLLLEELLYRIMQEAYRAGGRATELRVSISEWGDGAELNFEGIGSLERLNVLPDAIRPIVEALSAQMALDEKGGELRIRLPATMGGPPGG